MSAATVDVKKYICHLGCNKYDTQIAVVENSGKNEEMEDTAIRIYDVGRSKDDDDEAVIDIRLQGSCVGPIFPPPF